MHTLPDFRALFDINVRVLALTSFHCHFCHSAVSDDLLRVSLQTITVWMSMCFVEPYLWSDLQWSVRVQGSRTCTSAVPPTNIRRQQIPSNCDEATFQASRICHVVAKKFHALLRSHVTSVYKPTSIVILRKQKKQASFHCQRRQPSSSMQ